MGLYDCPPRSLHRSHSQVSRQSRAQVSSSCSFFWAGGACGAEAGRALSATGWGVGSGLRMMISWPYTREGPEGGGTAVGSMTCRPGTAPAVFAALDGSEPAASAALAAPTAFAGA